MLESFLQLAQNQLSQPTDPFPDDRDEDPDVLHQQVTFQLSNWLEKLVNPLFFAQGSKTHYINLFQL